MQSKEKDLEIPGYYRDPATGRYYRKQTPSICAVHDWPGASNKNVSPDPKKIPSSLPDPKAVGSVISLPDLLVKRQHGCKQSIPFDSNWLRLKTRNITVSKELNLDSVFKSTDDIVYLRGGMKSLYGGWRSETMVKSCIGEITHEFTDPELKENLIGIYTVPSDLSLADLCEGFSQPLCLMYVANNLQSNCGVARILWRPQIENSVSDLYRHYIISSPVWCCCSNNFTAKFALGIRNGFAIITASDQHLYSNSFQGNVHSVAFNKMGSVIYCGVHTGNLIVSDLRAPGTVLIKRIDTKGIDETVLLSDENYIICGGFSGSLCQFDLRRNSIVAEYYGHIHTPKKHPFSISEPHNYLSATGSDNVTRLWSLDGGEPLKCIQPVRNNFPCRSWLVTDGWKCVLYVIQKNKVYLYTV